MFVRNFSSLVILNGYKKGWLFVISSATRNDKRRGHRKSHIFQNTSPPWKHKIKNKEHNDLTWTTPTTSCSEDKGQIMRDSKEVCVKHIRQNIRIYIDVLFNQGWDGKCHCAPSNWMGLSDRAADENTGQISLEARFPQLLDCHSRTQECHSVARPSSAGNRSWWFDAFEMATCWASW